MFITFEGGEGTGKSTQVTYLAQRLLGLGKDAYVTREPGGTAQGEQLRNLLVTGDPDKWTSDEEVLLNYAARSAHIRSVILPALQAKKIVICDRFADSTWVYQAFAGDASPALIEYLVKTIVGSIIPDITFVLDIDPAIGILRSRHRMAAQKIAAESLMTQPTFDGETAGAMASAAAELANSSEEDRFEKKKIEFHQKVRAGFRRIVELNPTRCHLIDASRPIDVIQEEIWTALLKVRPALHG